MIIGTCSICSGPVVQETNEFSSNQYLAPRPYCKDCGARKKNPYGPVIDMEPQVWPTQPYPEPAYPEPCSTIPGPEPTTTSGKAGRVGVELFPFNRFPLIDYIIEATRKRQEEEPMRASHQPRMGNHGFFLVNGEQFLNDKEENEFSNTKEHILRKLDRLRRQEQTELDPDKYPFHGDLI